MLLACGIVAQALPFEPTTDPGSAATKWYYLKTEGLYVGSDQYCTTVSPSCTNAQDQMWCFVGTANTGYKVYNKQYHKYIGDNGYLAEVGGDDEYTINYYRQRQGNTFYLTRSFVDSGATIHFYLYYDSEYNELATYGTTGSDTKGCFEVAEASIVDPDPGWTRFDANGVGYKVIAGGASSNSNESYDKLCDNDASTKYCGKAASCWVTIEASEYVPTRQYSIVTANDSRQYADRVPRSWKLEGSRDNSTWFEIDVRNDSPLMPFANQEEVVFNINNGTYYKFFKFTCTAGANADCVQIGEIWINAQSHNWQEPAVTAPTCAVNGSKVYQCSDCKAYKTELTEPTGNHNYVDGKCTVCNKLEDVTILLDNGQVNPYRIKHSFAYRSNGTWPSAPEGWNSIDFDDSGWEEMAMPTASVGHTNGPFTSLIYNSYWYGEYNCHWFRRPFVIKSLGNNAAFTFRCVHDDNMVVYVNGQEVINAQGWTATPNNCNWSNSREEFSIPASAFKIGNNVLAVYIQQNFGGTYFDCELTATGLSSTTIVGDLNNDGNVNTGDVSTLYTAILNGSGDTSNCDLNNDGNVNTGDVSTLYGIILGN